MLLTVGLVLAVGAPLWWSTHDGPPEAAPLRPSLVTALADPAPRARTSAGAPASSVPTSDGLTEADRSTFGSRPVAVSIPSLATQARVRPIGVDGRRALAIPSDIHTVGWYKWGSTPGSAQGSVVLVGHLDSATQPGLGAFAMIRTLSRDARILVTTASGKVWRFRVVSRVEVAKDRLPVAAIFGRTGSPRLTLLTCGGSFDPAAGGYSDNVVVTAVPVHSS